ncbi:hypothetical protein CCUS01_00606 [Colletotrichum cuscutae]|uniref:Uncharacterized protein n=1 Tax=Colletotrichum cuscutae TaxID=1209917 RepID=A0AAI9Y4A1_9PEZI|nr:hypothetical protein CCUS01_00606 [Colletotrichum cuscutae]
MDPTRPPPRGIARFPWYPTVTSGPRQVLTSGIRHPHFQVPWLSMSNRAGNRPGHSPHPMLTISI